MDASSPPSRNRLARAGRVLVGAVVFAGGLLASGMFSSAVPAAPQDCLPVVGCVTTTTPSLPLSTVTLPTLPTTTGATTTTTGGSPPSTTTADSTTTQTTTSIEGQKAPETALVARTSVRVRGHGARRVVELRLQLTKEAGVSALLRRNSSVLARRQVQARAGTSLVVLRVARGAKPGLATLSVTFRSGSGETLRTTHRVRLPR